ncbi:hypothetical protein ACSVDA_07490 [Cytobacillus sp. Hm23]|uniref:hypothetical protein n=1 Tax=Bacillaceae TaxID=186817 RepID=UPI002A121BC5|nr:MULTISPECIES: hypothetical protein [unclassified Cytobacillus]MDX8361103.1 hypothetical protein [Cytobacillus sp. IB215316]MDX8363730.1 hypothetical protein [Cytobacillus sp. IB215665]
MFKNLPHGIKISISRSISAAFEQYMNKIEWNEEKYDTNDFIQHWRHYADKNASWFDKIEDEIKENPLFHEQLADKINETIEKLLSEQPTNDQIQQIESLVNELQIEDIDYACKSEAKYHIDQLTKAVKKNSNDKN